jgi:hypothetical protein
MVDETAYLSCRVAPALDPGLRHLRVELA